MSFDFSKLSDLIESRKFHEIVVIVGAGISTASGIPDFRSENGIFATFAKDGLKDAASVFDIKNFRKDPNCFYSKMKKIDIENKKPNPGHYFLKLLEKKEMLRRIYTQNIDGLEKACGISSKLIVESHGSFSFSHCIDCHRRGPKLNITDLEGVPICQQCEGFIKPGVVFYGEELPDRFYANFKKDLRNCDLLIVIGTSLKTEPFASLPKMVKRSVPRMLINSEKCGVFNGVSEHYVVSKVDEMEHVVQPGKSKGRDVVLLGKITDVVFTIMSKAKWQTDFETLMNEENEPKLEESTTDNSYLNSSMDTLWQNIKFIAYG